MKYDRHSSGSNIRSRNKKGMYTPGFSDKRDKPVFFPPPKVADRKVDDISMKRFDGTHKRVQKNTNHTERRTKKRRKSGEEKNPSSELNKSRKRYSSSRRKTSRSKQKNKDGKSSMPGDKQDSPAAAQPLTEDNTLSGNQKKRSLTDEFTSMLNEYTLPDDEVSPSSENGGVLKRENNQESDSGAGHSIAEEMSDNADENFAAYNSESDQEEESSLADEFISILESESSTIIEGSHDNGGLIDSNGTSLTEEDVSNAATDSSQERRLTSEQGNDESDNQHSGSDKENGTVMERGTVVKLPVLLAEVNFDIDIIESYDFVCPAANVSRVNWSLKSLDVRALLPSNTVFFKGKLIADVEYVSEKTTKLQTMKLFIDWKKTVDVDWLVNPEIGSSFRKEFTFKSSDQEVITHNEFSQSFADKVKEQLCGVTFVWHTDPNSHGEAAELNIEGSAHVSANLLQQQYVCIQ
ncbi:hypothetical protein [Virgibacillus ihumii]|uniref:hypothetical protein n=1 Tax=Virgibacillus ihumii TaxID=2686091 RepID=UPI00157C8C78|nr:hypothetical protein [Virgibacillus ihumii]